jgi:WD40 repeat protein
VVAAALSPDGRWVAVSDNDAGAGVFAAATGKEVLNLTGPGWIKNALAFSPNGDWAATASNEGAARVLDIASGLEVSQSVGKYPLMAVAFSSDGRFVAVGSYDKTGRVFAAATGELRCQAVTMGIVFAVGLDANGSRLAAAGEGGVQIFETAGGKEIWRWNAEGEMHAVAFSANGKWIATGGNDHIASVFHAATGKVVARVRLPGAVSFVSFTPDERNVIAATPAAAHVIDVAANQEIAAIPLAVPAGAVRYLEGGRTIEIATLAGNDVRIVREALRPSDLIQGACEVVQRNLSVAEWNEYLGPGRPERTCERYPMGSANTQISPKLR